MSVVGHSGRYAHCVRENVTGNPSSPFPRRHVMISVLMFSYLAPFLAVGHPIALNSWLSALNDFPQKKGGH